MGEERNAFWLESLKKQTTRVIIQSASSDAGNTECMKVLCEEASWKDHLKELIGYGTSIKLKEDVTGDYCEDRRWIEMAVHHVQ
jgi:hypothetical protein